MVCKQIILGNMFTFILFSFYIYVSGYSRFILLIILITRQSAALSSATQHAMPPEFDRKWGTECLNTRFPLPTLLCEIQREADLFDLFLFAVI